MESLATIPTFNIAVFSELESQISEVADKCKNLIVNDVDTLALGEGMAKKVRELSKALEDKRKAEKQPFLDGGKRVDEYARQLTDKLAPAEKSLRDSILKYKQEEERKRLAELEEIRKAEAALEAQRRAEEEKERQRLNAQNYNESAVTAPAPEKLVRMAEQAEQLKEIRQSVAMPSVAAKGIVRTWDFEVENPTIIPREYMSVDEKKIKAAITNGERNIPGVRIFQKETLRIA